MPPIEGTDIGNNKSIEKLPHRTSASSFIAGKCHQHESFFTDIWLKKDY